MAIKLPNGDITRSPLFQIEENKENILNHYKRDRVLEDYGIRIIGKFDFYEQLIANYPANEYTGAYGDCFIVGIAPPYDFYVFTRPFQNETENQWLDLGELAIQGPQGLQGEKGDKGDRGEQGIQGIQGPRGNTGPMGPQGPQGETGETGPAGKDGINGTPGDAVRIIGILSSSSMLPDPTTVSRDSAYVVEDGTGQWLYFITGSDTLIWDRVAFENGTTVLVGGNPVQTFDADTKLNKVSPTDGVYRVYSVNGSGVQQTLGVDYAGNSAYTKQLPLYQNPTVGASKPQYGGVLVTNDPSNDYQCANKKYVDDTVAGLSTKYAPLITTKERVYVTYSGGETAGLPYSPNVVNNSMVYRNSSGFFNVKDPTSDAHAANKKYVDENIAKYNYKTVSQVSTGAEISISSLLNNATIDINCEIIINCYATSATATGLAFTSGGTKYNYIRIFKQAASAYFVIAQDKNGVGYAARVTELPIMYTAASQFITTELTPPLITGNVTE